MSEITQSIALVRARNCGTMFSRTMWLRVDRLPVFAPSELCRARFAFQATPGCATRSLKGEAWWSQTGSNRRPHACKARALPAELWPRNQKTNASRGGLNTKFCQPVFALWASPGTLRSTQSVAVPRRAEGEAWWAWEDLNFRPHAYQARALTN